MSKNRVLRIGIASHEEIQHRTLEIARGNVKPKSADPKIWFTSHKAFRRVFSDLNMMLLEIIRDHAPESITELADLAKCHRPNVARALNLLHKYAVIEFVDGANGKKAPRLSIDRYVLTEDLSNAA